jgi:hypothetical protein
MAPPVSLVLPVSPHQAFVQAGIAPRATTGAEGIRKALEHSPDVASSTSISAGRGVRRRAATARWTGRLPTILISSHAPEDFVDLVAESPAVGFLAKSRLSAAAIREVLDHRPEDPPG